MGHQVTIYEKRERLGGMLRYGIPSYRLPREKLDEEIQVILSTGIQVKTNTDVGRDITLKEIKTQFDSVYIAIGAHIDKKTGIEGEDAKGVISAVEMLRSIGDGIMPDFTGKNVVVIGGGNVAMDVTRSSIRLGAKKVSCVYRRRQVDMTALPEEVEGAIAEGCEMITLKSPVRIEENENGEAVALWVQPQKVGTIDKQGRPRPEKANVPEERIPADVIVVAIGQGIETDYFEEYGISVRRGAIITRSNSEIQNNEGIFAGGDCVTGPATVIKAIAAGKVAAANIDEYLGFNHIITTDVEIPEPRLDDRPPRGRVKMQEVEVCDRKNNFHLIECGFTEEEAHQESLRCLRCDHFGYGKFKGGRITRW